MVRIREIRRAIQRGFRDGRLAQPVILRIEESIRPWISQAIDIFDLPENEAQRIKRNAVRVAVRAARQPKWPITTRRFLKRSIALEIGAEEVTVAQAQELLFAGARAYLSRPARVVARSEVHRVSQVASEAVLEAAGIRKKQWITEGDSRVRRNHRKLHRQVRLVKNPFKVPGTTLKTMRPGGFGIPEEDINCRCVVVPYKPDAELRELWQRLDRSRITWERRVEGALGTAVERSLTETVALLRNPEQ